LEVNEMAKEMSRDEVIEYLERKGKLSEPPAQKRKFTKEDEKEIEKVTKEGKIYGDPLCVLEE